MTAKSGHAAGKSKGCDSIIRVRRLAGGPKVPAARSAFVAAPGYVMFVISTPAIRSRRFRAVSPDLRSTARPTEDQPPMALPSFRSCCHQTSTRRAPVKLTTVTVSQPQTARQSRFGLAANGRPLRGTMHCHAQCQYLRSFAPRPAHLRPASTHNSSKRARRQEKRKGLPHPFTRTREQAPRLAKRPEIPRRDSA